LDRSDLALLGMAVDGLTRRWWWIATPKATC